MHDPLPLMSIVMPCLNEVETIEQCIAEARHGAQVYGIAYEIIVADNGSHDGSRQLAERLGARVVQATEPGYGSALCCGIAAASGRWVIMGDADASYDFGSLPQFIAKLDQGYDLVVGNRFTGGIHSGAMPWHHRYIGNPVLSAIGRLLFRCPIGDFHCGLRAFGKQAIEGLELSCDGMEFASEMIVKAQLGGLRMAEIPAVLRKDGRSRRPHLRSFRDGWRHLRFLLLLCPSWLYFVPGATLGLLGLLGLVMLAAAGELHLGGVTLSVNTSVICGMSLLVGHQLLLMGTMARRLARLLNLWPHGSSEQSWSRWFRLELGLAVGVCMALTGMCGVGYATLGWIAGGMQSLPPGVALSQVIPAATLVMLGVQTVFGSFFLGLIELSRVGRRPGGGEPPEENAVLRMR